MATPAERVKHNISTHRHVTLNQLQKRLRHNAEMARRQFDMEPSQVILDGEFMINSAGEGKSSVIFPVRFVDKPSMNFSFELKEGEEYVEGFMPDGGGVVLKWLIEQRGPFMRYYRGCIIGTVTSGMPFQKMIGVWRASGIALADPLPVQFS